MGKGYVWWLHCRDTISCPWDSLPPQSRQSNFSSYFHEVPDPWSEEQKIKGDAGIAGLGVSYPEAFSVFDLHSL